MATFKALLEKHNLISETRFHFKSFLLILRRQLQNTLTGTLHFRDTQTLTEAPVISFSESELWNTDDSRENWILTAGKIHNLRLGARKLNGIEVPANKSFSFWKHIGNPNIGKGYVTGREIREGCIVPTIAGGLCQLSNALYDAALKANFEIVERHRHTKVIKGSLAEQDRDATVKWNYVDLRFRSDRAFRIEIELTGDKLIVSLRSTDSSEIKNIPSTTRSFVKLNDCYSCGNLTCFKHPHDIPAKTEKPVTTFILDDKWNEYNEYIDSVSCSSDFVIVPMHRSSLLNIRKYNWDIGNSAKILTVTFAAVKRAIYLRIHTRFKGNIFALVLKQDKAVAAASAALIPVESTHVVISQNLLPFIWQQGVLGGRTFDVLMTRMPMQKLHEQLDFAKKLHPNSKTLNDFRAPQSLVDLENVALTKARKLISPHSEIEKLFNNKIIKIEWNTPKNGSLHAHPGNRILFPGAAYGRKGAYEVRQVALDLNLTVVLTSAAAEIKEFGTEYVQ